MIDPKFTQLIVRWLESEHTSDESIKEGATLLVRVNRDTAMYQRIVRRPQRELKFLEYKLRRILQMRKDGKTISDVVRMDNEITPVIKAAVKLQDTSEDKESALPVVEPGEKLAIRKGIRPDHDKLPEEIKSIWPKNAERWKKIKAAFETCKQLTEPCDRYEYLKVLKETWYKYKEEMSRYDEYRLDSENAATGEATLTDEEKSDLANADSYISKNLPKLLEACESQEPEDVAAESLLREKIQQRVDVLLKCGRTLTEERRNQLLKCGIKLNTATADE